MKPEPANSSNKGRRRNCNRKLASPLLEKEGAEDINDALESAWFFHVVGFKGPAVDHSRRLLTALIAYAKDVTDKEAREEVGKRSEAFGSAALQAFRKLDPEYFEDIGRVIRAAADFDDPKKRSGDRFGAILQEYYQAFVVTYNKRPTFREHMELCEKCSEFNEWSVDAKQVREQCKVIGFRYAPDKPGPKAKLGSGRNTHRNGTRQG
jgi:hypothetical protein